MKKLVRAIFEYEDDTSDEIVEPRALLLFQSRCNSSGIFAGLEDFVVTNDGKDETKPTV